MHRKHAHSDGLRVRRGAVCFCTFTGPLSMIGSAFIFAFSTGPEISTELFDLDRTCSQSWSMNSSSASRGVIGPMVSLEDVAEEYIETACILLWGGDERCISITYFDNRGCVEMAGAERCDRSSLKGGISMQADENGMWAKSWVKNTLGKKRLIGNEIVVEAKRHSQIGRRTSPRRGS